MEDRFCQVKNEGDISFHKLNSKLDFGNSCQNSLEMDNSDQPNVDFHNIFQSSAFVICYSDTLFLCSLRLYKVCILLYHLFMSDLANNSNSL